MVAAKARKILSEIVTDLRVRKYARRGQPVPFSFEGRTFYVNPERAAAYHICNSTDKIRRLVRFVDGEPAVVFDVGGNCGLFSAFMEIRFPTASVHCFEPSADLIPIIRKNCGPSVRVHELALGERDESRCLYVNPSSQQTNSLLRNAVEIAAGGAELATATVSCRSIDSFCAEHAIERIDVLKVDVQGFEGQVLRGARGLLPRVGQVFLEASWLAPGSVAAVLSLAERHDFRYAAVVNPVLMGADLVLSKRPLTAAPGDLLLSFDVRDHT